MVASKRDSGWLDAAAKKESERRLKLRATLKESERLLSSGKGLMTAKQVREAVMSGHSICVST